MAAQCVAGCAQHRLSSEARGAVRSEAAACEWRRSASPGARSTDCRAKREAPSEAKRRPAPRLKEVPVRVAGSHLLDGLFEDHPPRAHHVDAIDDAKRLRDVLLEQ